MMDSQLCPAWLFPVELERVYDLGSWLHDSRYCGESDLNAEDRIAEFVFDLQGLKVSGASRVVSRLVLRFENVVYFCALEFVDQIPRPETGSVGFYKSVDWAPFRARLDTEVVFASLSQGREFVGLRLQHHLQSPYSWAETICGAEAVVAVIDGEVVAVDKLFRDLITES